VNKFLKVVLIVFGIVLTLGLALFLIGYFKPKKAGILIETTPAAAVYLDGVQVGRTPYETTREPGEVVVKLVPESLVELLSFFETKVNLGSGIKTVVRREFGESEETSSGEVISFEKIKAGEISLAVISIPDSAQISLDGQARDFAPYKTEISSGSHQIAVSASGYQEKTVSVKTLAGYQLTAVVKLAKELSSQVQPLASPTPEPKTLYVEILETPSGFLRIREEPNTTSKELARVKPGEKLELIEEDSQSGWFKIETGSPPQVGWISNQYAKKLD
jgi:hypothetical protein